MQLNLGQCTYLHDGCDQCPHIVSLFEAVGKEVIEDHT